MNGSKGPPPMKGASGEHPIVIAFREKMQSIEDHTLPAAEELAARAEKLKTKSDRPPIERKDGDEEIPVDIVELPEEKPWSLPRKK